MFEFIAKTITFQWFHLTPGTRLAESIVFFLYDLPKIYFLLITIVFGVAIIRSFLPPEKIKQLLSRKNQIYGNILAACLGIFMPFCTCSAIPLFMGMLESGVPLGVTMSFLVSSPTINEIAVVMLLALFGWKVMLTYIASGLVIAIFSGYIIGRLKMENQIEKLSYQPLAQSKVPAWHERISAAASYSWETLKWAWAYIMVGVAFGALIHGYVPVDFVSKYAGRGNPLAVIIAVVIGVPIYANCAGAIPVVQAALEKGLPLGTSLAFLMAVTGLSLPEFLILRRVLKPKLLLTFFGTVAIGIILIGYFFNFVF
jgi:uncharacterized membrane protein YraQ (UPF0718 family)